MFFGAVFFVVFWCFLGGLVFFGWFGVFWVVWCFLGGLVFFGWFGVFWVV